MRSCTFDPPPESKACYPSSQLPVSRRAAVFIGLLAVWPDRALAYGPWQK
jgi:hypothetical protein